MFKDRQEISRTVYTTPVGDIGIITTVISEGNRFGYEFTLFENVTAEQKETALALINSMRSFYENTTKSILKSLEDRAKKKII